MPATSNSKHWQQLTKACCLSLMLSSQMACQPKAQDATTSEPQTNTACVLNNQTCVWSDPASPEDQWQVRLEQELDSRLFNLSINAPRDFKAQTLTITWSGLDMYLGYYPRLLDLHNTTEETSIFSRQMSLPICSVETQMPWKLELSSNGKNIEMPFTLVYTGR
jgi:hypothetical protein